MRKLPAVMLVFLMMIPIASAAYYKYTVPRTDKDEGRDIFVKADNAQLATSQVEKYFGAGNYEYKGPGYAPMNAQDWTITNSNGNSIILSAGTKENAVGISGTIGGVGPPEPLPLTQPAAQPPEAGCVGDCAKEPLPGVAGDTGSAGNTGNTATAGLGSGAGGGAPSTGGPTIKLVNSPAGVTTTGEVKPGEEKPKAEYNYVVGATGYTAPDGTKYKAGQVITSDQKIAGLTELSPEQKKFTDTYAGQYTYKDGVLSVTKDSPSSDLMADYNTKTTVSLNCEGGMCKTTTTQESFVCGEGLSACERDKDGKKIFKPIAGSKEEVTIITGTSKDEKGNSVSGVTVSKTTTIFDDKGIQKGYLQISYDYNKVDPEYRSQATSIVVYGTNKDGSKNVNDKIYEYDPKNDKVISDKIDSLPSNVDKDAVRVKIVGSGQVGLGGAMSTLTTMQSLGRAMKGYYEYQGLRQFSNMFWSGHAEDVKEKQDKIKKQFCLAAGIANCISSEICENIYDLEADNIVAGRGPGGQFVSSAALNAERTPALEVAGMTRRQLIDLFGNTTVIAGRLFNLTDPAFDPKTLGRLKIRLYHVQYSIRNNADDEKDLSFNIKFIRVDEAYNSSYAAPLVEAKWFGTKEPTLKYLESAKDDLYKYSATEYSDVCLTFRPDLPSGGGGVAPRHTDKLCVPFKESITPTTIEAQPQAGAEAPAGGAAGGASPGAGI